MQSSIMSYPDRGPWGDSRWRGNASGHIYRDLFQQLQPRTFADPMVGSGTSIDVAQELGIRAWGFDLHSGFDATRMSLLQAIGQEVCLTCSHPPYGKLLQYSGHVWGDRPHERDLSHLEDDEFNERMALVMLNQREATRSGGYFATLIGDWRRDGHYSSYQAELIARMPRNELAAVLIKLQHNTTSDRRQYRRMSLPRIMHEYLLVFRKSAAPLLVLLAGMAREQQARLSGTWKNIVRCVLASLGGKAPLTAIYDQIASGAPDKLATNPHWRDKVRQVLNQHPQLFRSEQRGEWALA